MKGKTWSGCVISYSLALRASSWWARDAETCLFCSVCVGMCTVCVERDSVGRRETVCVERDSVGWRETVCVERDSVGWRETEGAIGRVILSSLSVTGMSNNLLFLKYTCVGALGYPGFGISRL